jgi:hypothetical protein
MVTDDVKQTECYKNKSSTKHNRDEVKLCDYSTDSIGENNGVGFVFKMDVEDSYKTFLNVNGAEVPFYMSPNENVVYVIKKIKDQMCQIFLNETRTVCYKYTVLSSGNYISFKDSEQNIHLDIYDRTQTYYFINDVLVEHYVYNQTDLYFYTHYTNNITSYLYMNNTINRCEVYQNSNLIFTDTVPFNLSDKHGIIQGYINKLDGYILYEAYDVDVKILNYYYIYIVNYILNLRFSYSILLNENEYVYYSYYYNHCVFYVLHTNDYINTAGFNITKLNILNNSTTSLFIALDDVSNLINFSMFSGTDNSNALYISCLYKNKSTKIYFIDENFNIEIVYNPLNDPYFVESVMNFYKISDKKYRFFSINKEYPTTYNNWKSTIDLSNIFDCEINNKNYFNCSTSYISYLESNVQKNYSSIENMKVATIYYTNGDTLDLLVKNVIPSWNENTKTIYSNVILMDYNDKKLSSSNTLYSKMLYSTYMNNTDLTYSYNLKDQIGNDILIFDNLKSGLNNKFKCYYLDKSIQPNMYSILENGLSCKIQDIYSIPFLLPDRIQLFDSKFDFEYKSNLTSGVILFNMNPTYKVTTYTSTKTPIINILMSVVGIISPLIAAFTFVKKFWYKYENKEEINRRTSLVIDNPSIVEVLLDKNINNVDTNNIDINVELSKVRNNKDIV